jgi:hypothetical protein
VIQTVANPIVGILSLVVRHFRGYRFARLKLADLTNSPSGMEKLDAICTQLIGISRFVSQKKQISRGVPEGFIIKHEAKRWATIS